ncbi:hypothetical protein PR048_032234 [Dryococelus australis]|uniref:Uncharacterized protein n=1 Tax=Dryococelus australis TaxID=614101 RepID=A0ABQ9G1M7_9NEOP|nr:hypothetical protein PR048_032234 [Dryococelus australis]
MHPVSVKSPWFSYGCNFLTWQGHVAQRIDVETCRLTRRSKTQRLLNRASQLRLCMSQAADRWLDNSLPTNDNQVRFPVGFLGVLPFPLPLHSGAVFALTSLHSSSDLNKTSVLRAALISQLLNVAQPLFGGRYVEAQSLSVFLFVVCEAETSITSSLFNSKGSLVLRRQKFCVAGQRNPLELLSPNQRLAQPIRESAHPYHGDRHDLSPLRIYLLCDLDSDVIADDAYCLDGRGEQSINCATSLLSESCRMDEWLSCSDRRRAAGEVTSGREIGDCEYQAVKSARSGDSSLVARTCVTLLAPALLVQKKKKAIRTGGLLQLVPQYSDALRCDWLRLSILVVSQLSDDHSAMNADTDNRTARISRNALDAYALRRNLLRPDWLPLIATYRITSHYCGTSFKCGEPDSILGGVALVFSHVRVVPDDTVGWRVFSGFYRFPPSLHSDSAPYSPRFTRIGSQDIDVKGSTNPFPLAFTHAPSAIVQPASRTLHCLILAVADFPPAGHFPRCSSSIAEAQPPIR